MSSNRWSSSTADRALHDPFVAAGRLRWGFWLFALLCGAVLARVVSLEVSYGDQQRAEAAKPLERFTLEPALRGRILAADGTVLAYDEVNTGLAVHYRWLEEPVNATWLWRQALARLSRREARDPTRRAQAQDEVLQARGALRQQLSLLADTEPAEIDARYRQVQRRVELIAADVRRRRELKHATQQATAQAIAELPWWQQAAYAALGWLQPAETYDPDEPLVVAEETDYHLVIERLPLEGVAAIEEQPDVFRGVRLVTRVERRYPHGSLAAHALGYATRAMPITAERAAEAKPRGQMGLERHYEPLLGGTPALIVETSERNGRLVAREVRRDAVPGRDLTVSFDVALQRSAEALLDEALGRRAHGDDGTGRAPTGGAIVALDVQTGRVLCLASGPRFDAERFAVADADALAAANSDGRKPLVDRTIKMAIAPGSTFKVVSALALLDQPDFRPHMPFDCQGYWEQPDRLRCQLFRRQGIGHGPTTLSDALAQSCNVYFFHHAAEIGLDPLAGWARRMGLGSVTGIDLPGEVAGNVPSVVADNGQPKLRRGEERAMAQAVAIGQGTLTATPLQMATLVAAVANGGRRVRPHLLRGITPTSLDPGGASDAELAASAALDAAVGAGEPIERLSPAMLAEVRRGLQRVVADPDGTAHRTVYFDEVSIAGKTGTAETGGGRADHAWFAGYAPAERPRVALVVVLEHGGGAAEVAGPVVKKLVQRMDRLGYFGRGDGGVRTAASR
ncbi:MAG: hypothetical protein JSS27_14770 [Planctomycetes bacterium]|nr:hypothetical protein [Planctomycetota bacterium]